MRYGIVSDIHANLEALNAVLEHLDGVDVIISPGDIVGYGADPDLCVDIARDKFRSVVIGNHDAAVTGHVDLSMFNMNARMAALWTRDHLAQDNLTYLTSLPEKVKFPGFLLVHATLAAPMDFDYITSSWTARPAFAEMTDTNLCFIGHSHIAEYYCLEEEYTSPLKFSMPDGGKVQLKPDIKYIVNCGSVGQPRDGNPLASFGVYDTEAETIEIRRVPYDIRKAQKKIRDAGLPDILAERLEYGM